MKDEIVLLAVMRDAADSIVRYTNEGEQQFYNDEKTQDAVLRKFQIIGQVADDISDETQALHPEIEWRDIIGFRNVIVHDYLGLDLPTIWTIIRDEVPPLLKKVSDLISVMESDKTT